jgi:hypothetical protein
VPIDGVDTETLLSAEDRAMAWGVMNTLATTGIITSKINALRRYCRRGTLLELVHMAIFSSG